jgi:hypothetical protein
MDKQCVRIWETRNKYLVLRALLRQRGFVLGLRLLAFASSARGLRLHAFRPVLRFQKRDVFDLSVLFRAKHRGFVRLPHRKTSHPDTNKRKCQSCMGKQSAGFGK